MDDEVGDAEVRPHADEGPHVLGARVHAAVGDQPDEVDALGAGEGSSQHLVLRQRAVGDRLVDAREVLVDDRARTEVEVADLAVAHLPVRQPDRAAARGERRVRVALPEVVEDRRLGERDRVARAVRRQAPAVEDDEDRRGKRVHGAQTPAAAVTIAANDSGSSEAPPTSAPSTSGSDSSSAAFSAFTEPP